MNSSDLPAAPYASQCGATRRLIPLLVGGEMAEDLQPTVQSHLRECSACGAELHSYRAQADMLKSLRAGETGSPVPDLWTALAAKLKPRQ